MKITDEEVTLVTDISNLLIDVMPLTEKEAAHLDAWQVKTVLRAVVLINQVSKIKREKKC